ncbi:MAG: AbrB/MazE/SpoVT family DNA-binding domain-containing protein, partial [Nanoarchaeota archaeon]
MKRKILELGGTTHVVSIPHEWIKRQNLKKGDQLEVRLDSDHITYSLVDRATRGERLSTIDCNGLPLGAMARCAWAAYRAGATQITLLASQGKEWKTERSPLQVAEVFATRMPGFEIIRHDDKRIVIRELTQLKDDEFMTLFRRLFSSVITICESLTDGLAGEPGKIQASGTYLDQSINKLTDLCLRHLATTPQPAHMIPYQIIISQLEEIGDLAVHVADHAKRATAPQNVVEMGRKTVDLLRFMMRSFDSVDKQVIAKLHEGRYAIKDMEVEVKDNALMEMQ